MSTNQRQRPCQSDVGTKTRTRPSALCTTCVVRSNKKIGRGAWGGFGLDKSSKKGAWLRGCILLRDLGDAAASCFGLAGGAGTLQGMLLYFLEYCKGAFGGRRPRHAAQAASATTPLLRIEASPAWCVVATASGERGEAEPV